MNIIKRKENAGNVEKAVDAFNASFGEGVELEEASGGYVTLDLDANGEISVLENLQEDVEQDRIIGDDYDFVVDHYDKYGGMFAYEGTVGPYTLGQEYEAVDHDGTMVAAGIHVYPNGKATLLFNGKDKYGIHFNETYEFRVDKEAAGLSESLEEDPASETQKPFKVDMTLDRDENEAVEAEVYAEDKKEAKEKAEKQYDGLGYDIKDVEEVERHPVGDVEGTEKVLDESMLTEDEEEEIVVSSDPEEVNIVDLKKADNIFLALDELPIGSSIKGVYRVADDSGEEVAIEKVADDAESAGYFWSFDGYPNRAIEDTIISILNNENSTYMCYDFSEYFDESLKESYEIYPQEMGEYICWKFFDNEAMNGPHKCTESGSNYILIKNEEQDIELTPDIENKIRKYLNDHHCEVLDIRNIFDTVEITFKADEEKVTPITEDISGREKLYTLYDNVDNAIFDRNIRADGIYKVTENSATFKYVVMGTGKEHQAAVDKITAEIEKNGGKVVDESEKRFTSPGGWSNFGSYIWLDVKLSEELTEDVNNEEDTGVAAVISDIINKEYEVVNTADALSHQLENSDVLDILEDVTNEAHEAIGKLQACLELFSPTADAIEDGAEEAEQVLSESLHESVSLKNAVKDEINHKRSQGYSDDELSQSEILENILYDGNYDLNEDEQSWLENILSSPFMDKNKRVAIADLFRSVGESRIPFDLGESLNESILNKLNSPKLVLNEDRYDDWFAHDDRYDYDITDDYECLEDNLKIPYLSKRPIFLYESNNGEYILSDDDIYYTEDAPSELETFYDLDDAYDYIEVVSKLKEYADFEYETDFASEQDAVNWATANDDDDYIRYEVRKQHDGKYTIYTWTEGDLLTEGMSYKGYVISITQSGTNVIKNGKVIRKFATEDEAREFIDDKEKNESLTTLKEAAQTYTVNFLDEDENIIDTFSLKNLNTVRKRINARMADEEALYNDGITSIEVDNENGDSIFLALQDAPEFDDDGNVVSYGVWSIEQDDIDAAKEAELDETEQASVFNSVYSDLVAASDPAEIKLRRIKGRAPRYDYSEVGVDFDGNITISSEDTAFARRVADEYGLSIVETRDGVKLIIPEE